MTGLDDPEIGAFAEGDSGEQREAEEYLIRALSHELGIELRKREFPLGYVKLEVDGYSESPPVLCEAWAHHGPPKSAQKNKVMTDALKMMFIEKTLSRTSRKILLFADEVAAKHFRGRSWMAQALEALEIETLTISLPDALKEKVKLAQKRQYR